MVQGLFNLFIERVQCESVCVCGFNGVDRHRQGEEGTMQEEEDGMEKNRTSAWTSDTSIL